MLLSIRLTHVPFRSLSYSRRHTRFRFQKSQKEMPSPLEVCFLSISTALFFMYVVFLISLIAYQNTAPLRSGFFTLTFLLGVFDVLQMAHVYIFLRFPSFGWMTDDVYLRLPTSLVHYGSCAMWALALNQHLTVVFIALNRLSAIVFPHEHKQRWGRSTIRLMTAILCLAGPVFILPKVLLKSVERYHIIDNRTRSATIVWDDMDLLLTYKYVSGLALSIASFVCFLCYCSIFYTSWKRHILTIKRKTPSGNHNRRSSAVGIVHKFSVREPKFSYLTTNSSLQSLQIRNFAKKVSVKAHNRGNNLVFLLEKRELKLAMCGFVIFFFMFIYTIGVCNMAVDQSVRSQHTHRSIWLASSDLFSGINPLLLVLVSKTLRNRFLAILCCSCCERQYSPQQSSIML